MLCNGCILTDVIASTPLPVSEGKELIDDAELGIAFRSESSSATSSHGAEAKPTGALPTGGLAHDIDIEAADENSTGTTQLPAKPALRRCPTDVSKLPSETQLEEESFGTTSQCSTFTAGKNVHDSAVLHLSLKPLTASIRRPVWQLVYILMACCFMCLAVRIFLLESTCPSFVISGLCESQLAVALVVAVILARWRMPDHAIKLIGFATFVFALLQVAGCIVKSVVCDEVKEGVFGYGVLAPQTFALAYVFVYDQEKLHYTMLFAGCWCLIAGVIMTFFDNSDRADPVTVFIVGTVMISYPTFSFAWHRLLLLRARRALSPYRRLYDELWYPIQKDQRSQVIKLAAVVAKCVPKKQLQPCADVDRLMRLAGALQEWYQGVVGSWSESLGLQHKPAPLKSRNRVLEKVERSYQGNARRVLDLVRASIVVESIEDATHALQMVLDNGIVFVIKNRFDLDYDGYATNGYRDVNLQLSFEELRGTPFEGFVFELQIVLAGFNRIKFEGQHSKYIECRNLQGG